MYSHQVCRVVAASLFVIGFATSALAQGVPRTEISGGYQLIHGDGETLPKGWYGEVGVNVNRVLTIVTGVDGLYETIDESFQNGGLQFNLDADTRMHTFLGGARLNLRTVPRVVPFAELLAGAAHISATATASIPGVLEPTTTSNSQTEPLVQIGGGVMLGLSRAVGVRVAVAHRHIFLDRESGGAWRIAAGVLLGF